MGCLQLGHVNSLENGQTEACTIGFLIRNPLAGDSMQRSLHQTPSDLTTMADACRQRLTASRKKWHSDEDCFPAAHPLKLTYRRSAITKSRELLTLVSIP